MEPVNNFRASDKRLVKKSITSLAIILVLAGVGYSVYTMSQGPHTITAEVLGTTASTPTPSPSISPTFTPAPTL